MRLWFLCLQDPSLLTEGGAVDGYSSSWTLDDTRYKTNPVSQNPHGLNSITTIGSQANQVPIKMEVVPINEFVTSELFSQVS